MQCLRTRPRLRPSFCPVLAGWPRLGEKRPSISFVVWGRGDTFFWGVERRRHDIIGVLLGRRRRDELGQERPSLRTAGLGRRRDPGGSDVCAEGGHGTRPVYIYMYSLLGACTRMMSPCTSSCALEHCSPLGIACRNLRRPDEREGQADRRRRGRRRGREGLGCCACGATGGRERRGRAAAGGGRRPPRPVTKAEVRLSWSSSPGPLSSSPSLLLSRFVVLVNALLQVACSPPICSPPPPPPHPRPLLC